MAMMRSHQKRSEGWLVNTAQRVMFCESSHWFAVTVRESKLAVVVVVICCSYNTVRGYMYCCWFVNKYLRYLLHTPNVCLLFIWMTERGLPLGCTVRKIILIESPSPEWCGSIFRYYNTRSYIKFYFTVSPAEYLCWINTVYVWYRIECILALLRQKTFC